MKRREERLNQLLKEEVGKIVAASGLPEGALVTITKALVSPDYHHVKIYVSSFPEEKSKDILEFLNHNIYHLQKELDKKLHMKPVPKIRFIEDQQGKHFSDISKILKKEKT